MRGHTMPSPAGSPAYVSRISSVESSPSSCSRATPPPTPPPCALDEEDRGRNASPLPCIPLHGCVESHRKWRCHVVKVVTVTKPCSQPCSSVTAMYPKSGSSTSSRSAMYSRESGFFASRLVFFRRIASLHIWTSSPSPASHCSRDGRHRTVPAKPFSAAGTTFGSYGGSWMEGSAKRRASIFFFEY